MNIIHLLIVFTVHLFQYPSKLKETYKKHSREDDQESCSERVVSFLTHFSSSLKTATSPNLDV